MSKSKKGKSQKSLPALTDNRLAKFSIEAFSKASQGAIQEMGYVIEVIGNNVVRVNNDGTRNVIHAILD